MALDNRLFELMEGKNIINVSAKRFFFRGFCLFLGGLSGGYISTIDLSKHSLIIPKNPHFILSCLKAAFIRYNGMVLFSIFLKAF